MSWDGTQQAMKAPANTWDIDAAVGTTNGDLGDAISNGVINKWAKFKPLRSSQIGYITLPQRIALGHGFGAVRPLSWSVIQNNQLPDSFTYGRPRGYGGGDNGQDEIYRAFDFLHIESDLSQISTHYGYNKLAEPPIDFFLHIDGMTDAKVLSINKFYFRETDVKIIAKYRIGDQSSIGTPGNMEIPIDELTFYTGSGSVGNVGSSFKICATRFYSGSLYEVVAPQTLNVLSDSGAGVGFQIPLASVMPGGGSGTVWPQDSDLGYSFYPRFRDKDSSTYWSAVIDSPLRLLTYLFNPLEFSYNGGIAFYDGAPDSGGTLLALFTPDGNAVQITPNGQSGETVTWSSTNLYVRFYSIYVTNSDNATINGTILGSGGVELDVGTTIASTGVTGSDPTFTVGPYGSYNIGGMGRYVDFFFGPQSFTLISGGGSATIKRASIAAPSIKLLMPGGNYTYVTGQRLYYY